MNITKKIVATIVGFSMVIMMAPGLAQGLTVEELQDQITALTAQLAALQAQLVALQGVPAVGVPTACSGITFTRDLKQGMSGNDVKCLQALLNQSADTQVSASGAGSPGSETTYFGPKTKAAVSKYQLKNVAGTIGTGFVGPKTRAVLNAALTVTPVACTTDADCLTGQVCQAGSCVILAVGAGLTVDLADDTPAAATIVDDSTDALTSGSQGSQSMIPFLKVKLTNGDSSDVKVTQIKFKRTGISADADISQAYIYEGDTLLADYSSFTTGILTFSNSAGLVTVSAGGSKIITLKADLSNDTSSGKTIRFGIEASSDISSNASAVQGTFPLTGNYMSTAQASDIGRLTVATSTSPAAYVDPQEALDVFNFYFTAQDQKIEVRKLKFTNIGSTAAADLKNLKLYVSAAQLGSTIENMDSDKTVTFDLSANPIVIDKGVTKNCNLKADIVGGTNRTFQFSIQYMTDVTAYDTQYGIYIKPNGANSWTILQMSNASQINTGKLTLSRASDSPSGNVAKDGTNVSIAKFTLKATGEDVKISDMIVRVYGGISTTDLYQGKVLFDGSQKGTTKTIFASAATDVAPSEGDNTFSFGNTFIVPADGTTHTLEIKADIKKGDGTSYSGTETFTVKVHSTTAQGKTSMATVSVGTATGYQLTIATGVLTGAKNQAVADWSASLPTGVPGATEVLAGSFVVTAGASEGADVTGIAMTYTTTTNNQLQNLRLYKGTKATGTQIGTTQSSVTAGTSYTFYPSPYVSLNASEQITLNVYADILTGAAAGGQGTMTLGIISGTGKVTNTSVNSSGTVTGQTIYIGSAGTLTLAVDANTPKSAQIIMGTTGVEFTKIRFTAGAAEPISVTSLTLTATLASSAPTSTIQNISLWDGTTQIGSTAASLAAAGTAAFDITSAPWQIAAGAEKTLTVKSDINSYAYATSGGSVQLGFATSGIAYKGAVSGSASSSTAPYNGYAMYTYKTKVTVAKNASSPVGKGFAGPAQHVLYFDVTNSGSYAAEFNYATFTISYTQGAGNATTAATRTFAVYDSADLTTSLGSGTIAAGTNLIDATAETIVIDISADYEIPAGTTKTFYLIGDTSDCKPATASLAASSIMFYINTGTDFNWDDKMSTAVQSTLTKTFPLYGGVLTY